MGERVGRAAHQQDPQKAPEESDKEKNSVYIVVVIGLCSGSPSRWVSGTQNPGLSNCQGTSVGTAQEDLAPFAFDFMFVLLLRVR